MPNSLIVEAGSTVILEESMPAGFPEQPEQLLINKLEDLVTFQVIKSSDTLNLLLDTAKMVTAEKLENESTHTPFVPIQGTSRTNLRRFGSFVSRVQEVPANEVDSFWRIARTIDPILLPSVSDSSRITDFVTASSRSWRILRYLFQDITVEEGASLRVNKKVNYISCNDLLIKRSGQVIADGGASLFITANSIRGEQ